MKSIILAIIAAAVVSACAIAPDHGSTLQLERSPRALPASSSPDVRRGATPNVDLQKIYTNPDLHLAALQLRTAS